ncbi:MAG: hypothetical protein HQL56_02610 [Magnetococcales bacterium]|nr:hypothetical protein [Magnetococcales bacterium]
MSRGLGKWGYDRILRWLSEEKPPQGMPLCNYDRLCAAIRPGDVILVEGKSHVSEVIKIITQSPWSHAALYIGRLNRIADEGLRNRIAGFWEESPDEPLIIEALMDRGTVVSSLAKYRLNHLRIARPTGISPVDTQAVIHYAAGMLGLSYNIRQIVDLARFLLPYSILPRRWGSSLFQHNPGPQTRAVCSSMLAQAFMAVRFPILPVIQRDQTGMLRLYPRNFRLFTPRDFDVSPYFQIVKYPLLGGDDLSNYRNFPWATEGVVCNMEGDCYAENETGQEEKPQAALTWRERVHSWKSPLQGYSANWAWRWQRDPCSSDSGFAKLWSSVTGRRWRGHFHPGKGGV